MRLRRVRVRLLPWRPRWRSPKPGYDVPDVPLGDDPFSALVGAVLLLLALPIVALVLVGAVLLSAELLALLLLLPLLWTLQVLHLRPWRLVLEHADGTVTVEEVTGTRAVLRRRRELRALVG